MSALTGLIVVVGLGLWLASCSGPGKPLKGDAPYHHLENGFRNPPNSIARGAPSGSRMSFLFNVVWRTLTQSNVNIPTEHMVSRETAKAQLAAMGDADSISWIGHATFLVRLDGMNILTDPVFARRASPFSFAGPKRLLPPGLFIEDLPPIDVVVVSHAHYDHLDTETLDKLPNKQNITAIAPLGLGHYFTSRGFGTVHEVDWYDEVVVSPKSDGASAFRLTAYPAVHWSNRTPFDGNRTLWMSYGFSVGERSVFHTGDTEVHDTLFKEIGAHMTTTHGGCDLGLMSIGAYEPREIMRGAHMDPEGGIAMGRDVGCKRMVPMHWGTFILSFEPFDEPRQRFISAGGNQARVMKIGETMKFDEISR